MKICKTCKQEKEDYEFYVNIDPKTNREYFKSICKICFCQKEKERKSSYKLDYRLWYKYGISRPQWELILLAQDGKCKICSREFDDKIKIEVDHNHKTQVIRGLLCSNCNQGLGKFGDDPEQLIKAANYLKHSNALKEIS